MTNETEALNAAKDRVRKLRLDKVLLKMEIKRLQKLLNEQFKLGKYVYKEKTRLEEIVKRYKERER